MSSVATAAAARHRHAVKADLEESYIAAVGAGWGRHWRGHARLTRKEAAARLGLNESHMSAQIAGTERPQTERLEADDLLAGPMAVAKALQHPTVFEVRWTITAKVTA